MHKRLEVLVTMNETIASNFFDQAVGNTIILPAPLDPHLHNLKPTLTTPLNIGDPAK